ncbi:hypothetical protein GGX14DRAFT_390286 [Mycena pura]|uniref:Uncharacterized protein n=1 Tax=Mycena pura TaxID=153505 RepID=A0AAD6VQ59_9AGAR|nr:hypothetical protein GGX14DRAFT_390286 [Mycena pura]
MCRRRRAPILSSQQGSDARHTGASVRRPLHAATARTSALDRAGLKLPVHSTTPTRKHTGGGANPRDPRPARTHLHSTLINAPAPARTRETPVPACMHRRRRVPNVYPPYARTGTHPMCTHSRTRVNAHSTCTHSRPPACTHRRRSNISVCAASGQRPCSGQRVTRQTGSAHPRWTAGHRTRRTTRAHAHGGRRVTRRTEGPRLRRTGGPCAQMADIGARAHTPGDQGAHARQTVAPRAADGGAADGRQTAFARQTACPRAADRGSRAGARLLSGTGAHAYPCTLAPAPAPAPAHVQQPPAHHDAHAVHAGAGMRTRVRRLVRPCAHARPASAHGPALVHAGGTSMLTTLPGARRTARAGPGRPRIQPRGGQAHAHGSARQGARRTARAQAHAHGGDGQHARAHARGGRRRAPMRRMCPRARRTARRRARLRGVADDGRRARAATDVRTYGTDAAERARGQRADGVRIGRQRAADSARTQAMDNARTARARAVRTGGPRVRRTGRAHSVPQATKQNEEAKSYIIVNNHSEMSFRPRAIAGQCPDEGKPSAIPTRDEWQRDSRADSNSLVNFMVRSAGIIVGHKNYEDHSSHKDDKAQTLLGVPPDARAVILAVMAARDMIRSLIVIKRLNTQPAVSAKISRAQRKTSADIDNDGGWTFAVHAEHKTTILD